MAKGSYKLGSYKLGSYKLGRERFLVWETVLMMRSFLAGQFIKQSEIFPFLPFLPFSLPSVFPSLPTSIHLSFPLPSLLPLPLPPPFHPSFPPSFPPFLFHPSCLPFFFGEGVYGDSRYCTWCGLVNRGLTMELKMLTSQLEQSLK